MSARGNFVLQDLTGSTFGLLTVIGRAPNNDFGAVYWQLQCACGAIVERRANTLRTGKFFTCGKLECRFWEKVDKNGPLLLGMDTNCWVWSGATKDTGYGVLKVPGEKRNVLAHVFSYDMYFVGRAGRWVLHRCDNRVCVRPEHLFPGTHQDNMRDMAQKGRASKGPKVHLGLEDKARMVDVYRQGGSSYPKLAADFGVSLQTVGRVLRRAPSKE